MTRWIVAFAFYFYLFMVITNAQITAPPPASPAVPVAPTAITDQEKTDILILQAQLSALQLRQQQIASERDRKIESVLRETIEAWYQTPNGSQFGAVNAQINALSQQVNEKLKALGTKHGCPDCVLDSNMKLIKPPAPPKPQ